MNLNECKKGQKVAAIIKGYAIESESHQFWSLIHSFIHSFGLFNLFICFVIVVVNMKWAILAHIKVGTKSYPYQIHNWTLCEKWKRQIGFCSRIKQFETALETRFCCISCSLYATRHCNWCSWRLYLLYSMVYGTYSRWHVHPVARAHEKWRAF